MVNYLYRNAMMSVDYLAIYELQYIPEYKPRILGGFYKAKVGGSAYIRVNESQKKITS